MLSVVICTRDRPGPLARALADAAAQLPEAAELVVVDQSGDAHAPAVAAAAQANGARLVRPTERGLPAARNAGLAAARGEIVLFLDDDVRVLPGCLDAHVHAHERPGVGVVAGRIVERSARPNTPATANHLSPGGRVVTNLWGVDPGTVETAKGANMSFKRDALVAAGGFDPRYRGTAFLEDADASVRVARRGYVVRFEPAAEVVHLSASSGGVRPESTREAERWRFVNTGYFVRRHRGRRAGPWLFATFGAVALRRAVAWRDPGSVAWLMRSLREGWALAEESRWPEPKRAGSEPKPPRTSGATS
jgi:GT2 family glycosyltransferase